MIVDIRTLETELETAAAIATVNVWREDAIWTAPTETGARLRARLCLDKQISAAVVSDALNRWLYPRVAP